MPTRHVAAISMALLITACAGQGLTVPVVAWLTEETTTIELTIAFAGCTSGATPNQLTDVIINEDPHSIRINIEAELNSGFRGGQTCEANPTRPLSVTLEQPVGNREILLYDGIRFNPAASP